MLDEKLGEILALSTAICWTISILCWSAAGKRIGSISVGFIRLVIAALLIAVYRLVTCGELLPSDASSHTWIWLSLSGLAGFFIGDVFLFRAIVVIGPRLSSLLMALAPGFAAVAGCIWIGETLSGINIAGMVVTIAGVSWVVMERKKDGDGRPQHICLSGITFGLLGAAGQGLGLVMAKYGMQPVTSVMQAAGGVGPGPYDPVAATQIRVIAAIAGYILLIGLLRRYRNVGSALKDTRAMGILTLGAAIGPFIGVSLLLKSVQLIETGIAQTLVATIPVMILPFAIFIEKEHVSWRAAIGAAIAVAGVALIFRG